MKRYAFEQVHNLRDLGGYPAANGKVTQYGRFLRCDAPACVSDTELDILRSMGVTTVIDLRGQIELDKMPCAMNGADGFYYHHLPVSLKKGMPDSEAEIPELYFHMTEQGQSMLLIMQAIAAAPGGVLYHCSAGKDRTGVVSALLFSLVGVQREDILADYQVSYTYLREVIRGIREMDPDFPLFMGMSKVEYMDGFLDLLLKKYGSAEAYLKHIGMTENELNAIREKLLV